MCYETVIPHVIRRHVKQLRDDGTPPDLLVNVTNNAWFWGSSELEMHLACNIFRSVENGTPMVIAANGGLSGAIDSRGRVLAVSDRMQDEVVLAEVPLDASPTVYTRRGDVVALPCLIVCVGLTIISVSKKVSSAYKQGPIDETLPS
ncbi:MAG: nitrilase-related carbon-nitrogen hydrolase [Planctomycetota bacterium]